MHSTLYRLIRPTIRAMSSSTSEAVVAFPVAAAIQQKLTDAFQPSHLDVINESYMHNVYVQNKYDGVGLPYQWAV